MTLAMSWITAVESNLESGDINELAVRFFNRLEAHVDRRVGMLYNGLCWASDDQTSDFARWVEEGN